LNKIKKKDIKIEVFANEWPSVIENMTQQTKSLDFSDHLFTALRKKVVKMRRR
jgi:hypothetical protein